MKKILKFILSVVVVLSLLAGGATFFVVNFVNSSNFKNKITQLVSEKTGRNLTISGNVGWAFFPHLALKVRDLALSNPAGFKQGDFAKVGELDVQVSFLPLIQREIQVNKIILQNLNLQLIRNKAGLTNWQDLFSKGEKDTGRKAAIVTLSIANIDIRGARITWQDQQSQKALHLSNLQLQGKNINLEGTPFPLLISCDVHDVKPLLKGRITFNGKFSLNFNKQLYSLHDLQIAGQLLSKPLVKPFTFAANANIDANLNNQTLKIPNLKVETNGIKASGKIQVSNLINAPQMVGSLKTNVFDAKPLLHTFGIAKNLPSNALQNASAALTMQITSKFLKIPNLEIKFDNTKIVGAGSYSYFTKKYIVFNLNVNKINFDKYKIDNVKAAVLKSNKLKGKRVTLLKQKNKHNTNNMFNGLRNFMLDGDLHIGELKANNLKIKNLNMVIHGKKGIINVSPVSCALYGGAAHGNIKFNLRNSSPKFASKFNISKLAIQPLFKDLIDSNKISGTATLNAKLNTQGDNAKSILKNLNGSGKIRLNNGAFYGIDIREQINRAKALLAQKNFLKNLPSLSTNGSAKTDFGRLTADFKIFRGLLSTKNLLIQNRDFKVLGKGTANLASQILNLQLHAYGLITINKKTNFYVPIKITNTFSSPRFSVDFAAIGGQVIQDVATQKIGNQLLKHGIDKKTSRQLVKMLQLNKI